MKPPPLPGRKITFLLCATLFSLMASGQLRLIHIDTASTNNEIVKLSFFSGSEGYVAGMASPNHYVGYTTDSGRTYIKKPITLANVDFNGYSVNLTFGFSITGVKAFSRDTLIAYGDYGFVPAILYSVNGGNNFKLVYHSQFAFIPFSWITDMVFPGNGNTGFAVDADRILKTTDRGQTWTVNRIDASSLFVNIEAIDNNNLIVYSTDFNANKILKTTNGGASWIQLPRPAGTILSACFISPDKGWIVIKDNDQRGGVYYSSNGGLNWTLKNNPDAGSFLAGNIHFVNDSTGYAFGGFEVAKTSDSGRTWEPLPRDNDYAYLLFSLRDMEFYNQDQFWVGGPRDFIEISTNAGGATIPKAYFTIDTNGVYNTHNVKLNNWSRHGYQYKWFVNGTLVSTNYDATYNHLYSRQADTIKLVVSNGTLSDTVEKIQYFIVPPLPDITSFTPATGSTGTFITITGTGFTDALSVNFGNTPAASFTIVSDNKITATIAAGATGYVRINNFYGADSLSGFTYFPPPVSAAPVITAMNPESGPIGTTVTITGNNFNATPLVYFGDTKAQVTAASGNSITCIVPAGASYKPVTVLNTATHLSGNTKPFGVTFADSGNFTYNSFTKKLVVGFDVYTSPYHAMAEDIDGDGKTDLINHLRIGGVDTLYVHRNTSSGGNFSFDAPKAAGGFVHALGSGKFTTGDLDGDGKTDIFAVTNSYPHAYIFRNTSTPGNISFAPKADVECNGGSQDAVIDDLDNDGKPDLVVATFDNSTVSVVRNTSSPGYLSFARFIGLNTTGGTVDVAVGDIDGDGKKEVVSFDIASLSSVKISVFRNTSSPGNISFAAGVSFAVEGNSHNGRDIFVADYDGDSKMDVILQTDDYFVIFRNTSAPGNISFAPQVKYATNATGQGSTVANLSGDARLDFIGGFWSGSHVSLYRNLSTPGAIVNEDPLQAGEGSWSTGAADFNGDGKTDMMLVQTGVIGGQITIFENTMGKMLNVTHCSKDGSIVADLPGSSYQWQRDAGSGFVNMTNDVVVSGAQSNKLDMVNIPLSWNGNKFRCVVDSKFSSTTIMTVNEPYHPAVTLTASDTVICFSDRITFTATGVNGGPGATYHWRRNGENVGDNSPTFTMTGYMADNAVVSVYYKANDYCSIPLGAQSDTIRTKMLGGDPYVNISTPAFTVCPGNSITLTAIPAYPGTAPTYQWQIDGVNAGANNPVFTTTLNNTSIVRVIMQSNEVCGPHLPDTNGVLITVPPVITPSVSITMNTPAPVCQGNSIGFTAVPQNGNYAGAFQWSVNEVNVGTNNTDITIPSLNNNDRVKVVMTSHHPCPTKDTVHSNVIIVPVNPVVVPSITLAGNTIVTQGNATALTATVNNTGAGPTYTWQDSTGTHTWTNIAGAVNTSLNYTPAATGVKVRCIILSNAVCANPSTVTSNVLTFTVNAVTGVNPVPANSLGIKYFPNPVESYLFVESLNPADKWQIMTITDVTGKRPILSMDVRNKTKVSLYLRQLASGQYIAVLQRKQGAPVYLKFVKL